MPARGMAGLSLAEREADFVTAGRVDNAGSEIQSLRIINLLSRRRSRRVVRMLWLISRTPMPVIHAASLAMIVGVWKLEMSLGFQYGFAMLYVVPVLFASWAGGFRSGLLVSAAGAGLMALSRYAAATTHLTPVGPIMWGLGAILFLGSVSYLAAAVSKILFYEQKSSHTDLLTGLANRRLLNEYYRGEVPRARRFHRPIAVVFIDVDNFKEVNDRFGHHEGDKVLKMLADVLICNTREIDTVSRIGGDEFALLLPETGENGVKILMDRIHVQLAGKMQWCGYPISVSMGAAVYTNPPDEIDEALSAADRELALVKTSGKNSQKAVVMEEEE